MLKQNLLNESMDYKQIIKIMGEGDSETSEFISRYISNILGFTYVYALDSIGIRGVYINKLFNNCCGSDAESFDKTLGALLNGVYTSEEIENNLMLEQPIPFLDSSIKLVDELDEDIVAEYYALNKKLFKTRLKEQLKCKENKPYAKRKNKKNV